MGVVNNWAEIVDLEKKMRRVKEGRRGGKRRDVCRVEVNDLGGDGEERKGVAGSCQRW